MAAAPKDKAGPLVVFRCPTDLNKKMIKLAEFNLLERTDIILLAAEHLLTYLKEGKVERNLDFVEDDSPLGELDLSLFDDPSLNEKELTDEQIDGLLPGNKMPWD